MITIHEYSERKINDGYELVVVVEITKRVDTKTIISIIENYFQSCCLGLLITEPMNIKLFKKAIITSKVYYKNNKESEITIRQ